MSHKAFYQTFFQTEQLFRRVDDVPTFPAIDRLGASDTAIFDLPAPEPAAAPAVAISDPVLPPPPFAHPVSYVPGPAVAPETEAITLAPEKPETAINTSLPEPETMVDVPVQTPPAPTPEPPQVRRPATPLLSQKVLILVDEDLLPSDLLFLEKILKAVHLDVDGVDLLNVHGTKNVNFNELLSGKLIHHFFTFGVPFSRINLDIMMDRYQPVRFEGITFLMADTLPDIEADVLLKKRLWEALKKIFLWR